MRTMLPKDVLERFLDGPFQYEELRNRVSAYVGEKLAGQDANGGAQPVDIGQIDKSEGEDEDVNAVQQRRPRMIDPIRNTSKSPTTSENPSTVGLPTRHHQRHANRLHETRNPGVMRRNRVRVRRSVSSAPGVVERVILPDICPSAEDCQDVDEVGTEPSSDAHSDLFGLDWGDDPHCDHQLSDRIGTTELVVEKNCWHSLIPVRLTMCLPSQCVPSTPWRRLPSRRAELVFKEQTDHTSSTTGSDGFESRQALEAI